MLKSLKCQYSNWKKPRLYKCFSTKTNRKSDNQGSMTIEIALLIPIILGVVYLFLMYMIFAVNCSKQIYENAECLYSNTEDTEHKRKNQLSATSIETQVSDSLFEMDYKLRINSGNGVEKIRRWKLAADILS